MLILDELKKNDPQLRLVAGMLVAGFFILLAGLWWVQIVSAHIYEGHLETQSYRTVRLPALRGKILDCEGRVLAGNRPCFNLSLYLDDLSSQFKAEYQRLRPVRVVTNSPPFWTFGLGSERVVTNRVKLDRKQLNALAWQARYDAASSVVAQVSRKLGQPLTLNRNQFEREYETRRAMPYTIVANANREQVARFEEQGYNVPGADVELEAVRDYPQGTLAGHVLGYLVRDDRSTAGEGAYFSYRLPDYRGVVGIEGGLDEQLRGHAGVESVLVNSMGYREAEDVVQPPQPGDNVVLTIDLDLERVAAESLAAHQGPDARGAVVVMNVRNGDVLAMVSSPPINPIYASNSPAYLNNPQLKPQINRATYGNYAPGSTFKPVIALAALQNGLDPNAIVDNPGYVYVDRRRIRDLAPPGPYNLQRAIAYSCNTYFVTIGVRTGIENIVRMAEKFHFGERTGLPTLQETPGIFPTLRQVRSRNWYVGDTANISIGQGKMAVTPIQMAVAYSAIANGGTVFWPRLVKRIEPQGSASSQSVTNFPTGLVRDHLGVSARDLKIVREAMLMETEEGTGQAAQVPGLQICGKTGTAQVMNPRGQEIDRTVWFSSFAPYAHPRYAVVVMVQGRYLWGRDCAPIAHDIYEELLKKGEIGKANAVTTNQK